jgi:uncharacterized membrane protein
MFLLLSGLLLFLGLHSLRIFADRWRGVQITRLGEGTWKALYTVLSLAGFALIVIGYGRTRIDPVVLWTPPLWTYHLAIALTLPAFILIVAGNVPRNHLRAWLGHPMLAGTKLWALAHLISNGRLGDVLLFGGFLVWAIACFVSARRRDRRAGVAYARGSSKGSAIVAIVGIGFWALFAFVLHAWLIGVNPMAWMG